MRIVMQFLSHTHMFVRVCVLLLLLFFRDGCYFPWGCSICICVFVLYLSHFKTVPSRSAPWHHSVAVCVRCPMTGSIYINSTPERPRTTPWRWAGIIIPPYGCRMHLCAFQLRSLRLPRARGLASRGVAADWAGYVFLPVDGFLWRKTCQRWAPMVIYVEICRRLEHPIFCEVGGSVVRRIVPDVLAVL